MVHAGSNARFSLPFVNPRLCPEAGSSLLLPRLCGYQRAAEILLPGEPFDAHAAMQAGLVNKMLEPQDVLESAQAQDWDGYARHALGRQTGVDPSLSRPCAE